MKKKLKLLVLPLIIFGLTACGANKQDLQTAINNTNKAKSYHVVYKIDMGISSEGMSIEVPITLSMDMDLNTKLAKAVMTMKFLGIDATVNEYMDLKNNIIYVENLDETNSWNKQKMDSIDTSKAIGDIKGAKFIDETDEEYHYQAKVTPEDFQKNLELMGSDTTEGITLVKDATIDIYVNKKDNYISKWEADLKDVIESEEDVEYTKLKFSISISDLNKVSVKSIDQSIIDNAKETE